MFASQVLHKAINKGAKSKVLNISAISASLESRLGYKFADNRHLIEARTSPANRRIAFVGDAVLDVLIATEQYEKGAKPCEMNRARTNRLCNKRFKSITEDLDMNQAVIRGDGKRDKARLATLLEGLVGAVFLDARGKGADLNKAIADVCKALGI